MKKNLHPNNVHNTLYDFDVLIKQLPDLKTYLIKKIDGEITVDFSKPEAVYHLNKALLLHYYDLEYWEIAKSNLIPPVPGRADYIHYLADLLEKRSDNNKNITVLDVGTGASLIYPIIGTFVYDWNFVASDIDKKSIKNASEIIEKNSRLQNKIELRLQKDSSNILQGIVSEKDRFNAIMCNPPFFKSAQEASFQTIRKIKGLTQKKPHHKINNFSGLQNELWCDGGEKQFLINLIDESVFFKNQIEWFTCLVSNEDHLTLCFKKLQKIKATYQIIEMTQGNKKSRILVWKF